MITQSKVIISVPINIKKKIVENDKLTLILKSRLCILPIVTNPTKFQNKLVDHLSCRSSPNKSNYNKKLVDFLAYKVYACCTEGNGSLEKMI